ncbi:MAG: hypothetical protein OHK0053_33300 [Microscillaceae bacterium]
MDILSRKFKKILVLQAGLWAGLLTACQPNQNAPTGKTPSDSSDAAKIKSVALSPTPNLESFDLSFYGDLPGQGAIQMNLRRFGDDLSGLFWNLSTQEDVFLKGTLRPDGESFELSALNAKGEPRGILSGKLRDNTLTGNWRASGSEAEQTFSLQAEDRTGKEAVKIDDLELNKDNYVKTQTIRITFPQLLGIKDPVMAHKVNLAISSYFESHTLMDSVGKVSFPFSEEVTFAVTLFNDHLVSISKHHKLSKNNDTYLFDDSHGINMDYRRGKVFQIQDLFKPNALSQLNALLLQRINKSCGGKLAEEVLAKCKLAPEESNSFSLSEDKITFHLTERLPYEARGCGYVRIEYQELEILFNPSGPLPQILAGLKARQAARQKKSEG